MKKHITLFSFMLAVILLCTTSLRAQVDVSATGGLASASYTTLKAAFDAINAGTHTDSITIGISNNTTETATAVLNASGPPSSYVSVIIRPTGGAARFITGALAGIPLVDLNGADHVIIDGLNEDGNALTLTNTGLGTSSVIRFIADATYDSVTNCTLLGSTTTSFGVVFFSTGVTTGNDFNTVSYCKIGPAGANLPLNGIYSMGTSSLIDNSNNIITGNEIFDYFNQGSPTNGMNINLGNSAWSITHNRLYQTANRVYTSANIHNGIFITSGMGYTISDNVIGYANAAGTGTTNLIGCSIPLAGFPTAYTVGGTANTTTYVAINCAFTAGGTVSSIQHNVISGFALYTSSGGNGNYGVFCGIGVAGGNVNIGTEAGNLIGTVDASIYTASSASGGAIAGIYVTSTNTVNIQQNIIQHLDAMGTVSTRSGSINGITTDGLGATINIAGNTIGNTIEPNLRLGNLLEGASLSNVGSNFATTTGTALFQGIRNLNTGNVTIGTESSPNIVRNVYVNSTSSLSLYRGIYALHGTPLISYNQIYNISAPSGGTSYSNGGLAGIGILLGGSGTTLNAPVVTGNTVSNLSLTNTGTSGYSLGGIVCSMPISGTSLLISKNKIFNLANASTSTSATAPGTVSGIFFREGGSCDVTVVNNMISLGSGQTTNTTFMGIWAQYLTSTPTTLKIYDNSVNIEGTVATGSQPSMCLHRGDLSTTANTVFTIDAKDNIFSNTRTGGLGSHFAISNSYGAAVSSSTGWGAGATDYNLLNANTMTVGYWSGSKTFGGWQTASSCDSHSQTGDPKFVSPTDLHIQSAVYSPVRNAGIQILSVTDDFDGDPRDNPPDIGADEDGYAVLSVFGVAVPAGCPTSADGEISTSANGGLPPYEYSWSNGSSAVNLDGLLPGTYTVTVTDANLCTASGNWTVDYSDPVCNYTSAEGDVTTYQCYDAHITITVGGPGQSFIVRAPDGYVNLIAGQNILLEEGTTVEYGAYLHAYISDVFCSGTPPPVPAAPLAATDDAAKALSFDGFILYPNPAGASFTLQQKGEGTAGAVRADVYDLNGRMVLSGGLAGMQQREFNVSALAPGLYIVKVIAGEQVQVLRLIVAR